MRCSELKPMYCHPILRMFLADMRQNGWSRNYVFFLGEGGSVEAASYFLMQLTLHPATAQAADNSLLEEHNGTVGRCLLGLCAVQSQYAW